LTDSQAARSEEKLSWLEALSVYLNPRVLAMLFLGFSAGLPFALVAGTLTAWLAASDVGIAEVGMFAWVGILYSLKFLWAPLIDRASVPFLSATLGRRRGWMLVSQLAVAAALLAMSTCDPDSELFLIVLFSLAVAFASATQDIVVDAYRIEAVELEVQGAMAASYQLGYRIALLAAAGGALIIADMTNWSVAYQVMAGLMMVGVVTTLLIDEPESVVAEVEQRSSGFVRWLGGAVIAPFREFFQRHGQWALVLLLFISFYRVSDLVLGVMANPFYIDLGFSLTQIGLITKGFGFFVTILGAALGGVTVIRYGVGRPLVAGAVMLAVTNLCFAGLALVDAPDMRFLVVTISADNMAAGFTGTVFIAYLSGLTNVAYTATQYALLSSLMNLPGKIISGFSGQIVAAIDWFSFFVYASAMGIPGIILAIIVTRRDPNST
jgi:PAT family beta-lactamase induction signal transducer AmpG